MKAMVDEIFGLFVEDRTLAIAILVWIGVVEFFLRTRTLRPSQCAFLFLLGVLGIWFENVIRAGRVKSGSRPM